MKNRDGMTLIETAVALALSALLLVTTAGVIKSMQQKKKMFADRLDVQPWRVELAECLRDDLLRSREMRIGSNTLELSGFCGHDPATGEPAQMPVFVKWSLGKEGEYDILTRTETPRGGPEEFTTNPRTELMAVGIANLSIGSFSGREDEEEEEETKTVSATERPGGRAGEWMTMPKVLKLAAYGRNNMILIDELVYR